MDYSRANERIYTGAAIATKEDVYALHLEGVTAIVDAREEFDDAAIVMSTDGSISYLWDPTADRRAAPEAA
jgi:hypothetical protein